MHGPIWFPVKSIANLRVLILNWWTILEFRILNWNKPFSLCLLYLVLVKCSEFMGGGYVGCVIFLLTLCFHFNNSRFLMKQSPSAQPVLRILMHLFAGYVVSQVTTQWHLCLVFLIYFFFLQKNWWWLIKVLPCFSASLPKLWRYFLWQVHPRKNCSYSWAECSCCQGLWPLHGKTTTLQF